MNRMNSQHKRQSSNSSFNSLAGDPLAGSFSSLENFMNATKLMEDEIMVPSKLKEKSLKNAITKTQDDTVIKNGLTNGVTNGHATNSDVLDHYKFIRLVRNQFMHSKPFSNVDEYYNNELKDKNFKKTFEELSYHYNGLMLILDHLSNDAKIITEIYRENV